MAWVNDSGEPVRAYEFGVCSRVPGQRQGWGDDGCYYTVALGRAHVRLSPGDRVLTDAEGAVVDVQSEAKFRATHVLDEAVPDPDEEARAALAPRVATTAELELESDPEKSKPKSRSKSKRKPPAGKPPAPEGFKPI